ncbi:MAG: alpha-amylase [Lachnospiraceae bacterium]|nr:alpha-amylase [Lachnospiraceae bacterium]
MIGSVTACADTVGTGAQYADTPCVETPCADMQGSCDNATQQEALSEAAQKFSDTALDREEGEENSVTDRMDVDWRERPLNVIDDKYRTYYEIFVYSFYDSDGDGIGDLQGVIQKLDYLNDGDDTTDSDLGVNGIWLMPIMPSATYHKYDTIDYMAIDSQYGTMEDLEQLLEECHNRGIRVILDLAMNHSSSKHPWFLEAINYLKQLPEGTEPDREECPYLDYYHFSEEGGSGYAQVAGTKWYYEAQFWSEMPDLNLQNETVRKEFEQVAQFWLDKGVDGFRMDAVKEYVTGSVEENVEILTWFKEAVEHISPEAYLVCECWMDRIHYAQYYQSGVDSMFNFEFADKSGIISNVVNGRQKAMTYGAMQVEAAAVYQGYFSEYIDAPFYTNHDLGRSAGYYAGEYSEAQTKLGHALNLMMSGNVFLYYGEELGMKGSGKDENKRAPMYWSKDTEAQGMCEGPKDMDTVKMKYDSLKEQAQDKDSIYHYVKDVIRLRNQNPEIARGAVSFYELVSDEQICVISKEYQEKIVLLVFNISAEEARVDLSPLILENKSSMELAASSEVTTVAKLDTIGELLTGETPIVREGAQITMPPYSIIVLGE